MTASSVTYAELEEAVRTRADIIVGSGARWTTTKLQPVITRSLKKWAQLLVDAGDDTNLKIHRTQTNPSATLSADNWTPNRWIDQPVGMFAVRGIDIYLQGNTTPLSMQTFDEAERNDRSLRGAWWSEQNIGQPLFYRIGGTDDDAPERNIIQIYPWADAVYTCDIRYIPAMPPVGAGTSYDFVCGGEEFVILDAAMQLMVPDGKAGTAEYLAGMREERERVEQNILMALGRRASFRRHDSWLERRALRSTSWRWR